VLERLPVFVSEGAGKIVTESINFLHLNTDLREFTGKQLAD